MDTMYVWHSVVLNNLHLCKNLHCNFLSLCHLNIVWVFEIFLIFRLDALAKALSVIATATWLGGWLGVCHTPVLYQNG